MGKPTAGHHFASWNVLGFCQGKSWWGRFLTVRICPYFGDVLGHIVEIEVYDMFSAY